MAPPRKLTAQYEAEATRLRNGCLIHPSRSARKVYQMRHGPLTPKQYVCHHCDEPHCIEDTHHFVGTSRDNVRDAVAKGRHSCMHPHGNFKFQRPRTDDEKKRISDGLRKAYAEGRR